jgi:4,5-DOPA dioxygenase extradiol
VRTPAIFVSHGAPTLAIEAHDPTHVFLQGLGALVGSPKGVLCVSAHWEAPAPTLGAVAQPATIHDFYGFPETLYRIRYAAPGSPALASRAQELLKGAGITAQKDEQRGLDHGAWVPLMLAYPDADVPVVQLSVQSRTDAAHHLALGRALAPLRDEGILILGSGGATHDLRRAMLGPHGADAPPPPDVVAFEEWLVTNVEAGATDTLVDWANSAPHARANHPTLEHFLPLFVPLGAAAHGTKGRVLHRRFAYGALSMAAFAWD